MKIHHSVLQQTTAPAEEDFSGSSWRHPMRHPNRSMRESCLAAIVRFLGLSAATQGLAHAATREPTGSRILPPLPPSQTHINITEHGNAHLPSATHRMLSQTRETIGAPQYQLVVACCEANNQSLAWLDDVPSWWDIVIYHSEPHTGARPRQHQTTEIMLEEVSDLPHVVGMHLSTVYRFGIAEYTVFAPGDALYHSPYFVDLLSNVDTLLPLQAMSLRTDETHPPAVFIKDAPTSGAARAESTSTRTLEAIHYKGSGYVAAKSYRRYYQLVEGQNLISFFFGTIGLPQWVSAAEDLMPTAHAGMIGVSRRLVKRHLPNVYSGLRDRTVESDVVVPIAEASLMTLFGGRDLEQDVQHGLRHRRGRAHIKAAAAHKNAVASEVQDKPNQSGKEKRL